MSDRCLTCLKKTKICICSLINPIDLKTHVLILQHPQESDKDLGTALLTKLSLKNSTLKVGLSWRNLAHALGQDANPKEWVTLFLGSAKEYEKLKDLDDPLILVSKKGNPLPNAEEILKEIKGVILLDGNWSQSKAMWWRNPWFLKSHRGIINPSKPSLYGNLRREPRKESLSTIEAAYYALSAIEHNPDLEKNLLTPFQEFIRIAKTK